MRSSKCRVVIHSRDLTIACGTSICSSIRLMVRLFPVASRPCKTMVGGLGSPDYEEVSIGCNWGQNHTHAKEL